MDFSSVGGAWGAASFAATGVAVLGLTGCVSLIRDVGRLRRRKHEVLLSYNDLDTRCDQVSAANRALLALTAEAEQLYVRLGSAGVILEASPAFAALRHAEGQGDAVHFDLAAAGTDAGGKYRRQRDGLVECRMAERIILWSLVTQTTGDGGSFVEAFGRDVTAERRQEDSTAAKSRFLATVSHEMRTPLNGVLGMAGLLRDTGLTPEQTSYVDAVRTSGEALLSLINEILDFSRIEAGKFESVSEPVGIESLVEGLVELLSPRAQDKGIEIAAFVHPDVPAMIMGDGARLRQVLMNLAGNAVKFTDAGGVGMRVEVNASTLEITVADTGPGIAADRLEAVFQEFEQADSATASRHGGTGLGLAISRRIVEHLGGTVSVVSTLGKGSVFTVSLPLLAAPAMPGKPPVLVLPDLSGEQVILVSASPFEAPFLAERLEKLGAATRLFASAEAARKALAGATIVMADAGLGAEACRTLAQAAEQAGIQRRVILLSPYERRSFGSPSEAGYDGYLVKPVRSRSLAARFTGIEESPDNAGSKPEPSAPFASFLAGRRILLAEDNPINALLVCRLIERMGGTPVWAKNGAEALRHVEEDKGGSFALALFDVRMPGMNGLEAVAAVRKLENGQRHLPVVALTANAFAEDQRECMAAGFDAFLSKPLEREAFIGVLEKCIRQRSVAA